MRKVEKKHFDWTGRIETLEQREVMSADPLTGLLGTGIGHYEISLEHHDVAQEAPPLEHHVTSPPDFWIEPGDEVLNNQFDQIEQTLYSAHNTTGLNQVVADYGFTGIGQTVAVIDSGIAYDHFALGGGLGANYRVVGGWDFTGENDADPYDDGTAGSHGTHVAGIIGGDSGNDHGVAPGVDLVALRVFDDAGAGYFSWVENALQWVHNNRNNFENPITAINLSLGVSGWNSDTVPAWTTLEDEFAQLEADGIFIAVSAGNSYASYNVPGLGYPAASPYVVPVMSVTDAGTLASYSQRHTRAIAAPGSSIRSTVPDYAGNNNGIADDYGYKSGTSMASPYIAGSSVLVRQAMDFVGYAGITQDTIYDHMMATATEFFDASTGLNFKRINLEAAIDSLMPTDDYGSTLGSAFDLGTLGSSSSRNGVIGTLSDIDYFQFTAGSTGTVTFDATSLSHELVASWSVSGSTGTVSGANGETYSFDVVAGQTYTVGLSTSDGLGYYSLDISSSSTFSYVDWGVVSFAEMTGMAVTSENWYRIQASQAGYVTAESMFGVQSGQVNLQLYDANMQMVDSGTASGGTSRVDAYATQGEEFFLRVLGTNSDVDYRLSNLVSLSGTTVEIAGTAGDDNFGFTAGSTHQASVNGVTHDFSAIAVDGFVFNGAGGSDTFSMTGTAGDESILLNAGQLDVTGNGYTLHTTSTENIDVDGGGGQDTAVFYDSAGDDTFFSTPTYALMNAVGYQNTVDNFTEKYAFALNAGNDWAYMNDSAGDDRFYAADNWSYLKGDGFYNQANGFDKVFAVASSGDDRAHLYDTPGDDRFYAYSTGAYLKGTGFYNHAQNFDRVYGYATAGDDRAHLFGTADDDLFHGKPDHGRLQGVGYYNYAQNFKRIYAYGEGGANDRAYFYGTEADDLYHGATDHSRLQGNGYYDWATGFESNYAYAYGGNDRAYLYTTSVTDVFTQLPGVSDLVSDNRYNYTNNFEQVYLDNSQMTPTAQTTSQTSESDETLEWLAVNSASVQQSLQVVITAGLFESTTAGTTSRPSGYDEVQLPGDGGAVALTTAASTSESRHTVLDRAFDEHLSRFNDVQHHTLVDSTPHDESFDLALVAFEAWA